MAKISDLKLDPRNVNKGTEYGGSLLEKSLREVGAGRSVLVDKNNVVIAGNQTVQKAAELGMDNVVIVDSDGTQVIVVRRTDLDINTADGVKMKVLDNTISKINYVEDVEVKDALVEDYPELDFNKLGMSQRLSRNGTVVQDYSVTAVPKPQGDEDEEDEEDDEPGPSAANLDSQPFILYVPKLYASKLGAAKKGLTDEEFAKKICDLL